MIHLRELINLHAIPLNVNGTNEYTNDEQSLVSVICGFENITIPIYESGRFTWDLLSQLASHGEWK